MIVFCKRHIQQIIATWLFIVLSSHVSAASRSIELQLSETASITGSYIYLSEVSGIRSDDKQLEQHVSNIRIAKAPRIGYARTLTRPDIEKIISRQLHNDEVSISWHGASEVLVTSHTMTYSYSEIESIAKKSFLKKMEQYGFLAVVEQDDPKENIELPAGLIELKARLSSEFIGRRNCVWVDIFVNDEFYRAIPVWITANVTGVVLVAKNNLNEKTEISSRDFVFKDYLIVGNPHDYVSLHDLSNTRLLVSPLHVGEALLMRHIKPMPDVIGGNIVSVDITQGNVNIQLQGIARRDGNMGEVLRVQLLHNNEFVMARVVGRQQVSVI